MVLIPSCTSRSTLPSSMIRERARVREAVAVERVVEVGMRVEVDDRQRLDAVGDGLDQRPGHQVIAAERQQRRTVRQCVIGGQPDRLDGLRCLIGQRQIAEVGPVLTRCRIEVEARLGAPVGGPAGQRGSDRRGCSRRPAQERRVSVVRDAEQLDRHRPVLRRTRRRARRRPSPARRTSTTARRSGGDTRVEPRLDAVANSVGRARQRAVVEPRIAHRRDARHRRRRRRSRPSPHVISAS